jgi:hypothetical protein
MNNIFCVQGHDFLEFKKFMDPQNNISLIAQRSTDPRALGELKALMQAKHKESIDILFIDGAHDYKTVMEDFYTFAPLVGVGGYIVFDDYNDYVYSGDVKRAVLDIMTSTLVPHSDCFEVRGTLPNLGGAKMIAAGFLDFPWTAVMTNEFVLKVIKPGCILRGNAFY